MPIRKISTLRYLIGVAILIPLLLLFYQFTSGRLITFKIISNSMYPTLLVNDFVVVVVSKDYVPARGDVIAFVNPRDTNELIAKRVIALSDDKVKTKGGYVYLNGKRQKRFQADRIKIRTENKEYTIGKEEVFVLGDNRNESLDSLDFGPVTNKAILGKVTRVYWPLSQIRKVE